MSTIGFESIDIGIMDEDENITDTYTLDKQSGGAINASISGLGAEMSTVYASNAPFYISALGTGQPELELQVADIPDDVLSKISGADEDADGIMKLGDKTQPPFAAVVLKTQGMGGDDIYVSLLKGKFQFPDQSMSTVNDSGAEPSEDTITFNGVSRNSDGYVYAKTRSSNTNFSESSFRDFALPKKSGGTA
ncbi:hypothetical protein GCM10028778_11750 [Barrientosiimonas marina]|uniref:Major tail protein n=1 Tax=Lentibacillus kimchii TaxID=1542911 RepID=A0ABW2V0J0_9BACI